MVVAVLKLTAWLVSHRFAVPGTEVSHASSKRGNGQLHYVSISVFFFWVIVNNGKRRRGAVSINEYRVMAGEVGETIKDNKNQSPITPY